jgi:exportin-1
MAQASRNMQVLDNMDNVKILANVLKTNVSACVSVGPFFLPQIGRIFLDMLGLYKVVSGIISETVAREGTIATKTPKIRNLRTIKKEILKLMETFIKQSDDLETINSNLIPPLLDAILGDYNRNVPAARDAEVLNVMSTITTKLGVCHFPVWHFTCPIPEMLTISLVVSVVCTSSSHPGGGVRADVEYDQPRLHGVP